ncbi:MAG: NUDIX domain-containing protein [Parcubacteria group bacterium]
MFIGKLDPPHWGHIINVEYLLKEEEFDRVLIVMGSVYCQGMKKHPLSAVYREKMYLASLVARGINIDRVPVIHLPDFHDFEKWYGHILKLQKRYNAKWLVTGNTAMITDQIYARKLPIPFERIFNPEMELPRQYQFPFHSTDMREMIERGDWEGFRKVAAPGTLQLMGAVNGFEGICQALEHDVNQFVEGRQAVDAIIVNRYEGKNSIICGYRSRKKPDFPGALAVPGGAIRMYENPESAAVRQAKLKTGLTIELLERYLEPTPVRVNGVLTQMKSLGVFSPKDPKKGHKKGGSCQPFLLEFSMPPQVLSAWLLSSKALTEVWLYTESFVKEKGLAFQQLAMVQKAGYCL